MNRLRSIWRDLRRGWQEADQKVDPPIRLIWQFGQFWWRFATCMLPTMILLSWLFGGVGKREPRGEDILAIAISATAALVWARETCWRRR